MTNEISTYIQQKYRATEEMTSQLQESAGLLQLKRRLDRIQLEDIGPVETPLMPIEDQAKMYLLLWELSGHIETLRKDCVFGKHLLACNFARSAILDAFGVLKMSDGAMALARKMKEEMPDCSRKVAIDARKRTQEMQP